MEPEPVKKSAAQISSEYLEAVCKAKGITLEQLFKERPDLYADHCRRENTVATGAKNIS
jgi:hypothetical protein